MMLEAAVALPAVCDGETGPHAGIQIRFGPPVALHGVTDQRHRTGAGPPPHSSNSPPIHRYPLARAAPYFTLALTLARVLQFLSATK